MSSDPPARPLPPQSHPDDLIPPPVFGTGVPRQVPPPAPARPRRRWAATVGTVVTTLAIVVSTLAMTRSTVPEFHHAAASLMGPDGHVELLVQGTQRVTTLETADLPGVRGLRAGPQSFLSTGYTADEIGARHWLRLSRVNRGPSGYLGRSDTLYALDATGLVGHVNDDGKRFVSFQPGLLELPADVHAGSSWDSDGTMFTGKDIKVDGSIAYRYTARAEADPAWPGCLRVVGRLSIGTIQNDSTTTWCPGRGTVAETDSEGTRTAATAFPAWADPRPSTATQSALAAVDLSRATLATIPSVTLPLTPEPAGPPTFGGPGEVVASRTSPDVIGLRIAPEGVTRVWRAAPGGIAFTQATFGDVTVVGTTLRRLVAYDADGQRLWQVATPEVATRHPFVRLDPATLVATFVDGRVAAFDLRTGELRWEARAPSDLQLPPVVADGRVYVATPTGSLLAFDAASGAGLWSVDTPDPAATLAAGSGQVYLSGGTQGRVYGMDGATGAVRWEWIDHEDRLQLLATDRGLIVIGETSVYALDPTGSRQLWRRPVTGAAALVGTTLIVVDDTAVRAVSVDGRDVGHWALPVRPRRPASTWVAAAPDGSAMITDSFFNLYRLGTP